MMKLRHIATIGAVASLAWGCIENDIPYPRIQANILSIEAVGQDAGAAIDSINRTVTLYLPEEVDINNVSIESYSITSGASVVGDVFDAPIDLSSPAHVTLHLYQDWTWTITGSQNIDRYFSVAGQVGNSSIDVPGRRVIAYVSKTADLTNVLVESIKLGPNGSEMTPDLTGMRVDFTHPVEVDVTAYGRTQTWTIFVQRTDITISTVRADAWTCVAWIYGQAEAGKDNGVEYRLQGDSQWTRVAQSDLTVNGGDFCARIIHLQPETTYEARAFSGDARGETLTFTTGAIKQVPNTDLDQWWLDGKVWCPWEEGGTQFWDTGNKGATTLGTSNSFPTDETSTGSGWAAKLETRFVGIGSLGKLAAGNIFVGRYVRTDGTNGILHFGREWNLRPTRLKGWVKYTSATINYASAGFESLKGQPDTGIVWIALIDQDEPFEIRTNPKNRQVFDPDGDYVVAYGKVEYNQSFDQYIPFEIELQYKSTERVPKYILITASASALGDYFTGGSGSTMWIDDLQLLYDY